jgi:gluconate 2-dehydrogenase gamma chain
MPEPKRKISRRLFLKGAGAVTLAGVAAATSGCEPSSQEPAAPALLNDMRPIELKYPGARGTPPTPPDPARLRVFTMQEARTVEALTARILPGTPDDPGAREAGVVTYIDALLALNEGFAEPTYRQPPYAQVYQGDTPPANHQGGPYQAVYVPADLIDRYGFQAILTPREVYRIGLEAVDRYATERFGRDFAELPEQQQDTIVGDMAEGRATGFRQVSAEQFFLVLRRHTAEGMFSDPAYGGNRGLAGWRLIGFPGAQRAWTPREIQTEGVRREPQSQDGLAPFNPGQASRDGAVLPLSGSDPNTWHDAHQHPSR